MSHSRTGTLLIALLVVVAPGSVDRGFAQATGIVAVFPIEARDISGLAPADIQKFTGLLDTVVSQSGWRTVPRTAVRREQLVQAKAESYDTCYDDACQIELGRAVSADKILVSTWVAFAEACELTIKLFDVATELTELAARAQSTCDESGLWAAIDEVGGKLVRRRDAVGTFTLDLEDGRGVTNPPTDTTGFIAISARAKGDAAVPVEVFLNGALAGTVRSGALMTKEVPVGRYVVVLRAQGGMFAHRRFDIEMTTQGVRIPGDGTIELPPTFGHLAVQGEPRISTAIVDGQPHRVNGLLRLECRAGTHSVVIEAPDHLPSTYAIELAPGEDATLRYRLTPNTGVLEVTGQPAGADVMVDGRLAGQVPLTLSRLSFGSHRVRVSKLGYQHEERIVSIARGETRGLDVKLAPRHARLKVEGFAVVIGEDVSIEAEVYINGEHAGSTPWKGEVQAEVELHLALGLGTARSTTTLLTVAEGDVRRVRLRAPSTWAGANSSVRFDSVSGPWVVRSGERELELGAPHPVRPGKLPVELLLDGHAVSRAQLTLSPNEDRMITITRRPKTAAELEAARRAWAWRRWISLSTTIVATGLATQQLISAHAAAATRDSALRSLETAGTATSFDSLRAEVVAGESEATTAEIVGLSLSGAAGALLVWTLVEWLWAEPEPGELRVVGMTPIPVEERP